LAGRVRNGAPAPGELGGASAPVRRQIKRFDLGFLASVAGLFVISVSVAITRFQLTTVGLDLVINTIAAIAATAAAALALVRFREDRDVAAS
jgi:hypothetical protein